MDKGMTHGSLFSGVGGFDLASEWMGWENKFHCEWNEFCQRVLKYYWPDAKSYGDIDNTDFTIWRGCIDVLSGGFPCQPYSTAGKRQGKEDVRHKWPQMLRAIREIQPGYVVGENVRGLTNWNEGMVFDEVQADLEAEGYEVLPFLLPACGVNAPHRRERIWFVAHRNSDGYWRETRFGFDTCEEGKGKSKENKWEWIRHAVKRDDETGAIADANSCGFSKQDTFCEQSGRTEIIGIGESRVTADTFSIGQQGQGRSEHAGSEKTFGNWKASWSFDDGRWPLQSPICSGNDGLPGELDGITFPDFSKGSHEGYGNAIVPQVAYQIFKVIDEIIKWQKV